MPQLNKATLISIDPEAPNIEFMFNPSQLDFSRSVEIDQPPGARNEEGMSKSSFKHPNPYTLTISNILIETYESGGDVIPYIAKFKQAVEFAVERDGVRRPPIYLFTWGGQDYLRCFVKSLKYKLTQFHPNGRPARAFVDLTLEEIDLSHPKGPGSTPQPGQPQRQQSQQKFQNKR